MKKRPVLQGVFVSVNNIKWYNLMDASISNRSAMTHPIGSRGLGLRRGMIAELIDYLDSEPQAIDFLEVAPENWINLGCRYGYQLRQLTERYELALHGLSLNIGGFAPLDEALVLSIKDFIQEHQCGFYSDHLSYCGDEGHLYDLMPIPFSQEAINHTAERILRVQDSLGQRIAVENVSYYGAPFQTMPELEFINAVIKKADCELLLDVNNIYVNSINHGYNAEEFLLGLPLEKVSYVHVAGHFDEAEDLRIDTHGSDVIDPVWSLLQLAYKTIGVKPTLLERDFNFPSMPELFKEIQTIESLQAQAQTQANSSFARKNMEITA